MDLLNLEQQRQALESNLEKLRASLKHWQTWEAEYEGLKEEIVNVEEDISPSQLTSIAKSYDGELVNEKEVLELAGLDKDSPRSAAQIIGLIERRQEYVQKNIETTQRQFFDAEAKAEELAFAARNHNPGGDAGLPLTEIHEELDDDGNVISSSLSQPEESTAQVVESLRKAGMSEGDLKDAPHSKPKLKPEDLKPAIINASPPITPSISTVEKTDYSDSTSAKYSDDDEPDLERPSIRKKKVSFSADTKASTERPRAESEDGKKVVSFNEKIAVMPAAPPPDMRSVSFSPKVEEIPPQPLGPGSPAVQPQSEGTVQNEVRESFQPGNEVARPDENDDLESMHVVIPEDESPDDARTRSEMLEYHLNEVGNVVAQIDLEDPDIDMDEDDEDEDDNNSYHTTSEYLDDEDTPYTTGLSESEESEDEHGRSKRRVVTPEYSKQMEQLEQKLIGNLGPQPKDEDVADADADLDAKDVRKLVIRDKRNSTSSASSESSEKKLGGKKRVSFAESIDVAEPGSPPLKAQKLQESENVSPVSDTISERTTAASHSLPAGMANEKVSRFKQTRAAPITLQDDPVDSAVDEDMNDAPSGPPGVTIANTLLERPQASRPAVAPSADDPDPAIQRRELAAEYYRRRNDMIKQQGGFRDTADEDDEMGELMEERDGKLKKVSRFKAARIKPQT